MVREIGAELVSVFVENRDRYVTWSWGLGPLTLVLGRLLVQFAIGPVRKCVAQPITSRHGLPNRLMNGPENLDVTPFAAVWAKEPFAHRPVANRHPAGAGIFLATSCTLFPVAHRCPVLADQGGSPWPCREAFSYWRGCYFRFRQIVCRLLDRFRTCFSYRRGWEGRRWFSGRIGGSFWLWGHRHLGCLSDPDTLALEQVFDLSRQHLFFGAFYPDSIHWQDLPIGGEIFELLSRVRAKGAFRVRIKPGSGDDGTSEKLDGRDGMPSS
jgi:hypothetical protein